MERLQNIGEKINKIFTHWKMESRSTTWLDKEPRTYKWLSITTRRTSISRLISNNRHSRSHAHNNI
eukprot:16372461-Heterocapsa_arctica.AAC.1